MLREAVLEPSRSRAHTSGCRNGSPAGVQKHLQPHAAPRRACGRRDARARRARLRRYALHARRAADPWGRAHERERGYSSCPGYWRTLHDQIGGPFPGQRRHRFPAAHGRPRAEWRRLQTLRGSAHARAPDPRSRGCLAPDRRAHRVSGHRRLSAARDWYRRNRARPAGPRARFGIEPVRHRALDCAAARATGVLGRDRRRAHLEALRRNDAEYASALRCGR